jgi:hypothetical protein
MSTRSGRTFEQISRHPVAGDLLRICACLAPERIPRELLEAGADNLGAPDVSAPVVGKAIELLLGYALLTPAAEQTWGFTA